MSQLYFETWLKVSGTDIFDVYRASVGPQGVIYLDAFKGSEREYVLSGVFASGSPIKTYTAQVKSSGTLKTIKELK